MTSGLRRSADTGPVPRKRCRTRAIAETIPSRTAPTLESAATIALVFSELFSSEFVRNSRYQCRVKPLSGNVGSEASLKEKISRITIGAYRKTTTRAKNALNIHAPDLESATSISPRTPASAGGSERTRS
jgi:hypothetical protein